MTHRFPLCLFLLSLAVSAAAAAQPAESNYGGSDDSWNWSEPSEEGSSSSYLGVDIADITADRLGVLKLKEEHGAEITMVDEDAPAGKAGLHEHDVIVSLNDMAIESAAQLRRIIKETPPGRIISLGISRDGQPMTIKVQLADRHKSMSWEPKMPEMPDLSKLPKVQDFDLPVSVVVVHQLARSGLMVEDITAQLGDFFGVKDGKGVLVRSVEKGSRGEKAGFRAGDVVVKVNNQRVHDASDFTHALRASSGGTAAVTIMREKREQTLTLTLPAKKDSGMLIQDGIEKPDFNAEMDPAIEGVGDMIARMTPAIVESVEKMQRQEGCWKELEKKLQSSQQKLQDSQRKFQDRLQKMRRELSPDWADI